MTNGIQPFEKTQSAGLIALEAQLASVAQRHLQLRFHDVYSQRGEGWIQFTFPPISGGTELAQEVQQLCCALLRDITGGCSTIRLSGETTETGFSNISNTAVPLGQFLNACGDVAGQIGNLDGLVKHTSSPAVQKMLETLYLDVVGDLSQGILAVTNFSRFMCPMGDRFDVLLKGNLCIKAFSESLPDPVLGMDVRKRDSRGQGYKHNTSNGMSEDVEDEDGGAAETDARGSDSLKSSSPRTGAKLPVRAVGKVWMDTFTLARAMAPYAHQAGIESELPAAWRSKSFGLLEAYEVLQQVFAAVKNYWNTQRSLERTERAKINALALLAIISGDLREYVKGQIALSGTDWRGPWRKDLFELRSALRVCSEWQRMMMSLTREDWHDWDGGPYNDESFNTFLTRLQQVVRVREELEQASLLMGDEALPADLQLLTLFEHMDMMDLRQEATERWSMCMAAYEKEVGFAEPAWIKMIKLIFASFTTSSGGNDDQIRRLLCIRTLLKRKAIYQSVERSMANVAQYLLSRINAISTRCEKNLQSATTHLQKLRVLCHCEMQCCDVLRQTHELFDNPSSSLPSTHQSAIGERCREVLEPIREKKSAFIPAWRDELEAMCQGLSKMNDVVTIETVGGMANTHKEGEGYSHMKLCCLVHDSLQRVVLEAATFHIYAATSANGVSLSGDAKSGKDKEIPKLSEAARNILQNAEQLLVAVTRIKQSVANFNTVLQQIISSTRPMLEPSIQRTLSHIHFADTNKRIISFSNYQELEGLSLRFQNSVESLSSDNRHIRRFHNEFVRQVMTLHNVDLTKHMVQWRNAVDGMRSSFEEFLSQHHFRNVDAWRRHWDCQIYKALEYQYRLGLERMHETHEEFKVELVFKQGLIQFKPTLELIRDVYYLKLREFISVPLRFRGLQSKREDKGERYEIYPTMPIQNKDYIVVVHTKAIELFTRLSRVRKAFRQYVSVGLCGINGMPDLDSILGQWCAQCQQADDGCSNPSSPVSKKENCFFEGFQVVKEYRTKLSKIEDVIKVDCFSISTIPLKASIEGQLHRLEESLMNEMRKSIQSSLKNIDEFVFNASNVIERQPTTMEEVGRASKAYREYTAQLPEFEKKLRVTDEQNKKLRQYSGASIDLSATKTRWEHLREAMASHTKVMEDAVSKMRVSLDMLIQKFLKDVQRFSINWGKQKAQLIQAFKERKTETVPKLLVGLKDQIKDLGDLKCQSSELEAKCEYFNQPKPNFSQMACVAKDVDYTAIAWAVYDQFMENLARLRAEDWLTFRSHTYQFEDFCKEWGATLDACLRGDASEDNAITEYLMSLLAEWNGVIPLLKVMRGDGWLAEYWNEMFRMLDIPKGTTSTDLTFGDLLDRYKAILANEANLKQLQARAQGEIQLRGALEDLRTWDLEATFTLIVPTDLDAKVKLISDWKELMTAVSDNQSLVNSLKDSPFFVNFADEANDWERKLASLEESLMLLNSIQRKWAYLEPIFARGVLLQEQASFKRVDKEFVGILREIEADPRVMNLVAQADLNEKLRGILEQTERSQKSLIAFLEAKRDKMPRFYFISDEDLLEILGHSQNPLIVQAHLKKLFMGIHTVRFNKKQTEITHMLSADGECVELLRPISIVDSNNVEDWLIRLDETMKQTLHELLLRCLKKTDLTQLKIIECYPSQILQVAQQILFASNVEKAIKNNTLANLQSEQRKLLEHLTNLPLKEGEGGGNYDVSRLKVKALILDAIHNHNVIDLLVAKQVRQVSHWLWQKQLRYSMDAEKRCWVHMTDTIFEYTYEYQGNAPKLVHTPLTDRCYLVLTKGMNLGYGGNPFGPAGTGKTESVKALGSAMGRQVLVFNCDEGIDFKAMGRILVGIVKCGAWGCFDEFNRLKVDQLSAISQMIQVIQEALKNKEPTCPLLNRQDIMVNPHAGIFVTLNPAGKGYGGRSKLPDNLKQLFREVAMSVPDNELIASILLLAEGFVHARTLATNVVELFKLSSQLLSSQQHYDWGLRPLKAVLQLGGTLLQEWRRSNRKKTPKEADEACLMVQSLGVNTLSKLTFADAQLFSGLLKDVFPGVPCQSILHKELEGAVTVAMAALGLERTDTQVNKVLQLYEAIHQRTGVVLVGPSGSGKSTLIRLLRKALEAIGTVVPLHRMNPKAMPRQQLLGYMDPDTRVWYDGVLTIAAREAAKQPKEVRSWIWCDGDIDPLWIESLNSVLDDNKLLTMPNGVRIQFGSNVNFIFETHSLEFASPATVSRLGVIFLSDRDVSLDAVVVALMEKQRVEVRQRLTPWIKKYIFKAIDEALRLDDFIVPTTRMGVLNAALSHVLDAENEANFIYSLIRGISSVMNATGVVTLATWLYAQSEQKPQSNNRPLDTYWDSKSQRAMEFVPDLRLDYPGATAGTPAAASLVSAFLEGCPPVVRTVEVQRLETVLRPFLREQTCKPVFLVGPGGCGKSCLLRHCLASCDNMRTTTINCSAQTGAAIVVQKIEQLCSAYSTTQGRVYRPKDGDRLFIVLKNVGLPKPDKYGTVELHAFLQQLVACGGFYNKELEWVSVERVQVVATMTPAVTRGDGHGLSARLLGAVHVVSMTYPCKKSLALIYRAYWSELLKTTPIGQGKDYNGGQDLVSLITRVYDKIRGRFEGGEYAHIHFSPRHLTRWVASTLLYKMDAPTTLLSVLAYEAQRLFADCLPRPEDRAIADKIFAEQFAAVGYALPAKEDRLASMFITWFMTEEPAAAAAAVKQGNGVDSLVNSPITDAVRVVAESTGGPARPGGIRLLEERMYKDIAQEVTSALLRYSREFKSLDLTVIPPVVCWISYADRLLARPAGHLVVVGRPGVGRRDSIVLASYLQRMEVVTFNVAQEYGLKNFRADLRAYIQRAVGQDTRLTLMVEEHHIVEETFLELLNSLVSSGEVPGLFTPEEMESMYAPLREEAASEGFIGPIACFYLERLRRNLHVAFIMDPCHDLFLVRLRSNPALLRDCEMLWMGVWSADTTKTVCKTRLKEEVAALALDPAQKGLHLHREMYILHQSIPRSTPRDFQVFMETYAKIGEVKRKSSEESIMHLEAGLAKLREAEEKVESIKADVAKKKSAVEAMQQEADAALNQIQKNMQDSQEQREEATELQDQLHIEQKNIVLSRKKSEDELSSIRPLMEAARDAISSIRSEQLNEVRSLKSPPEPIRDVLEGVLALLGVGDVSWQSMRSFLAERGVKERIIGLDVSAVTPQICRSVAKLLQQKSSSFKPEVIQRASTAAAPMAAWVKAMVEYATIMEHIAPLTEQIKEFEANQREGEEKLGGLQKKLKKIDKLVKQLREEFSQKCKEAERLRGKLKTAEADLVKAQELLEKLSDEKVRWAREAASLRVAHESMPRRILICAAFMTYLSKESEDVRLRYLRQWSTRLGFGKSSAAASSNSSPSSPMDAVAAMDAKDVVRCTNFLRTENSLLQYKSEGLPGDELSLENAIVMLDTVQTPLVIDPANQALEWMKTHLKKMSVVVEVTSLHDERFTHTLELAIRFGKTLLVTEVNAIAPMLYPILRRDLISAGAKRVMQVGAKTVDWQDTFRIFLFSRSAELQLPPGAAALVTLVNFSVTSRGLESQLLSLTLQHERPELETEKRELLKKEEDLKMELTGLEAQLLQELADSKGNLMENAQLITSLNSIKAKALVIQEALSQSSALQDELDEKRDVYRPLAQRGADIYFLVRALEGLNHMYNYGLNDFIGLFNKTLRRGGGSEEEGGAAVVVAAATSKDNAAKSSTAHKIKTLAARFACVVFQRVCTGLLKRDRLVFGLHFLRGLAPAQFPSDQWAAFVRAAPPSAETEHPTPLPSWAPASATTSYTALVSTAVGQGLVARWRLHEDAKWSQWMVSEQPELFAELKNRPNDEGLSMMEMLLVVSVFRPDRLSALGLRLILSELRLPSLVPATPLEKMILSACSHRNPLLLITSSGADPSMEVQDIAIHFVGRQRFTQVALGGGQTDAAMEQLRRCAAAGDWLFLKNLHLVLDWAFLLEKELSVMPQPHTDFRLIITTEPHDLFPTVLLRMSTKVMVESPPGVKQNLLHSYQLWDRVFLEAQSTHTAQILFGVAWLHAIAQVRRTFVPQGWTKPYDFTPADLKAATDIVVDFGKKGANLNWTMLKGFLYECIYGGRIDSPQDETVLRNLVRHIFTEEKLLRCKAPLFEDLCVPATNNHDAVMSWLCQKLPEVAHPMLVMLPDNADRVVQESIASLQLEQLRTLHHFFSPENTGNSAAAGGGVGLLQHNLKALLTPVMECWKANGPAMNGSAGESLNSATTGEEGGANMKDLMPLEVFFLSEANLLTQLQADLSSYMDDLHAVMEGTLILQSNRYEEVLELAGGRMPKVWLARMEGPREVKSWLGLLARKWSAIVRYRAVPQPSQQVYNLVDLLRPQTLFNALRQHTARLNNTPLVNLALVVLSETDSGASSLPVRISVTGSSINIQGASMDGGSGKLRAADHNSPSSVPLPVNIVAGWVDQSTSLDILNSRVCIPVYTGPDRSELIFNLAVPSEGKQEAYDINLHCVACFLSIA